MDETGANNKKGDFLFSQVKALLVILVTLVILAIRLIVMIFVVYGKVHVRQFHNAPNCPRRFQFF